jgi:hypothetical protein
MCGSPLVGRPRRGVKYFSRQSREYFAVRLSIGVDGPADETGDQSSHPFDRHEIAESKAVGRLST